MILEYDTFIKTMTLIKTDFGNAAKQSALFSGLPCSFRYGEERMLQIKWLYNDLTKLLDYKIIRSFDNYLNTVSSYVRFLGINCIGTAYLMFSLSAAQMRSRSSASARL